MATEITGRIGLVRAEDSTGCVVAIDGHWFDVADILAEPDVGLVQLHGVSSTGAKEWHHLDAAPCSGSAWTSRASVSGHERAPRHDRDGLARSPAWPRTRLCAAVAGSPADDSTAA